MKQPLPNVTIQCDVTNVYAYLTGEKHEPRWATSFGIRRTVENQLVAFAGQDAQGTPVLGSYTLEPAGDSTRVVVDCHTEPSGFKKLLKPLMAGGLRREAQEDLTHLAEVLGH